MRARMPSWPRPIGSPRLQEPVYLAGRSDRHPDPRLIQPMPMPITPDAILDFWLGPVDADPFANAKTWWKKDPAFDAEVTRRFGAALEAASRGELDIWQDEPRPCAALIVLTDQLSRNIHRGSAAAFAQDGRARAACEQAQDRGLDVALRPVERVFVCMPLMHAEDLAAQNRGIVAFATLAEEAPEAQRPRFVDYVLFAVKHQKIIRRFGRFPHRNALLGRTSTAEEAAFLEQPGSSF
jgi:uncharacterized protein (DUF924 family)